MSSWKKVRNLFWQSGAPVEEAELEAMSDEEFASLVGDSPLAVPTDAALEAAPPVDLSQVAYEAVGAEVRIDFQAQYDAAGIPDTDEVEKLGDFLSRLDTSLPQVSKLAAAAAFLGAIGKSPNDVLADAERKITTVRALLQGKAAQAEQELGSEQAAIAELQGQIEVHRQRMQAQQQELEGFRHACVVEESRLQAARVFFGSAGKPSSSGGQGSSGSAPA